jgi:hypothetical protein
MKLIIGFEYFSENGFQENPEADVKVTFKRKLNVRVRPCKFHKARFQEKYLRLMQQNPYRKPTQVIRSSRPRRTSERSSRNSAKKQP